MKSSKNIVESEFDLCSVPNLPQYNPLIFKEKYALNQRWNIRNGLCIEKTVNSKPKSVIVLRPLDTWKNGNTLPQATTRDHYFKKLPLHVQVPASDALENKILRFFGYFSEHVEDKIQNYRHRLCTILYHLEDDTMQINEPTIDNSGLQHGILVKRHRFPDDTIYKYVSPHDLVVGGHLTVYGKTFKICSCDRNTREWYEHNSRSQPHDLQLPVDSFIENRNRDEAKKTIIPMSYEKRYREVNLGGWINANMEKFMKKDTQVCRFYAIYDDCLTMNFKRRKFVILFYLCDDTVEIREILSVNSGFHNFPVFLKRKKIPRGKFKPIGPADSVLQPEEYFNLSDFLVGKTAKILAWEFLIYDADKFTRNYILAELGIKLIDPIPVDLPLPSIRNKLPPIGSVEDSTASVDHIHSRPVKFSQKNEKLENCTLQISAELVDSLELIKREFFIIFFMNDNTFTIYEKSKKNSGRTGGRFLQRGTFINKATGKPFILKDFSPGEVVEINKYKFLIKDVSGCSSSSQNQGGRNDKDFSAVVDRFVKALRERHTQMSEIFRQLDEDKNEVITIRELGEALTKIGFNLSDKEVEAIFEYFDVNNEGKINFQNFQNAMAKIELAPIIRNLPEKSQSKNSERIQNAEKELSEAETIRKAVRDIQQIFYEQPERRHRFTKELRHATTDRTASVMQIYEALKKIGHFFPIEAVTRCVAYLLPGANLQKIDHIKFIQKLAITYNDLQECC